MRWGEVYRLLRTRGLYFPTTGLNAPYVTMLGLSPSDEGAWRNYDDNQVRLLLAWFFIGQITGQATSPSAAKARHDAALVLAVANHGWVAMSEGVASWHETVPTHLLSKGLVCLRVPDWQVILDTEHLSV